MWEMKHSYFLAYMQIRPVQLYIGLADSGGQWVKWGLSWNDPESVTYLPWIHSNEAFIFQDTSDDVEACLVFLSFGAFTYNRAAVGLVS